MTESESRRLAALVRQAGQGEPGGTDAWHGPSLRKVLEGVGAEEAARHPIAGALRHGTLHHDVYHAGQIALLRRAPRR